MAATDGGPGGARARAGRPPPRRPPRVGTAEDRTRAILGHRPLGFPPARRRPSKTTSRRSVASALAWVIDHASAVLALVGLALYAVVRLGDEGFYGRVRVAPEEVGLSQASILGRASLSLLLFVSIVTGGVAAVATILHFLVALRPGGAPQPFRRATEIAWSCFVLVAFLPVFLNALAPDVTVFLQRGDVVTREAVIIWMLALVLCGHQGVRSYHPAHDPRPEVARAAHAADVALTVLLASVFWTVAAPGRLHPVLVVIGTLLGLAIVSTAGVVWLRSRPTRSGAPGADRSSPVTGHQPSSALAWYRFRTRAALQLVAIALPGVVFLARPEWVAPVMPSFESLRDATVAERLWKLGLPILCLAAFSVAVIGAGRFVRPPAALTPKGSHARTDQEARVLVAATLAVVACLLLISFERGKTLAEGAGRGDRLRQSGTLLNVSAEPVCLLGADPPFGDAGPYMLLGRSDGQIVLLGLPGAGSPVPGDAAPTLVVPEEPLLYLGNDSFPATRARDRDRCRRAREDSIAGVTTTTASS